MIGRVDDLSGRVVGAVERMPAAVRESREPLVAIASDLASQVRWTPAGLALSLLLMGAAALWVFYALVLRPGRHLAASVAGGAHNLIRSLEHIAEVARRSAPPPANPPEPAVATAGPEHA